MACQLHLLSSSIVDQKTNQTLYQISRPSKLSSLSLSQKAPTTITRSESHVPIGTVLPHTLTSTNVDLTINGHETRIKSSIGLMHEYWTLNSIVTPSKSLWWSIDYGGLDSLETESLKEKLVLMDAKKQGRRLATLVSDALTLEVITISHQGLVDEVVVSAVGMVEIMKQREKAVTKVVKAVVGM